MKPRVDVLIAGGGVLGSAIAWSLARGGVTDVCVVDVDLGYRRAAPLHAWPVRAHWDQPLNLECGLATLDFLREQRLERPGPGHVWLTDPATELDSMRASAAAQREQGLRAEVLDPDRLAKQFPLLERAAQVGAGALWVDSDANVDPVGVREWFRSQARELGVEFLSGAYIEGCATSQRSSRSRRVESVELAVLPAFGGHRRECDDEVEPIVQLLTAHSARRSSGLQSRALRPGVVINALGPWSSRLRAMLGGESLCRPAARQLSVLSLVGHEGRGSGADWPGLVVDPAGAYFFADSAYTISGLDAPPRSFGFDLRYAGKRFFEDSVWPHLAAHAEVFERVHHLRGTVLLEAVTPDRSGVLGPMHGYSNVFDAFGFGGSALSHAYAVARGMAEWIIEGRYESLDLSAFDGQRFAAGRPLVETRTL